MGLQFVPFILGQICDWAKLVSSPFIYFCYLLLWNFAYVLCLSEILPPFLSTIQSFRAHSGSDFLAIMIYTESQIRSYFHYNL